MTLIVISLIALACALISALPLLVQPRRVLYNPAFYMFVVVVWSVLLKILYVVAIRPTPHPSHHDRLYVNAESPEFVVAGLWLVLASLVAWACGYFVTGRGHFIGSSKSESWTLTSPTGSRRILIGLGAICVISFAVYLHLAGSAVYDLPLSAKRFTEDVIGSGSRFGYLPYYFFKIGLTASSVTYGATLLFTATLSTRDRVLVSLLFSFTLLVTHFASLRLYILMLLAQLILLLFFYRVRGRVAMSLGLGILTFASFVLITFVDRAPRGHARVATSDTHVRSRQIASRPERLLAAAFEGRYFCDVGKIAHLARHFPAERRYLGGRGLFQGYIVTPGSNGRSGETTDINEYIAERVFDERGNNVPPGFIGEMYIHFGWIGVIAGLSALGVIHRIIHNHILLDGLPLLVVAVLIVLMMNSTLVLLNSGIRSAVARTILDCGVVFTMWFPFMINERRKREAAL